LSGRRFWATALVATALLVLALSGAAAQSPGNGPQPTGFRAVQKWLVRYHDRDLGLVEDEAYCDWAHRRCKFGVTASGNAGRLRESTELDLPFTDDGPLLIAMPYEQAGRPEQRPEPGPRVTAGGGTGRIILRNGEVTQAHEVPVVETSRADNGRMRFLLRPTGDGDLVGEWFYQADPVTGRDLMGFGPSGVIDRPRDDATSVNDPSRNPGGFRAVASGGAQWLPLLPRIVHVHVLEDQSAFAGALPKYTHPSLSEIGTLYRPDAAEGSHLIESYDEKNVRTLVIFGQDLPIGYYDAQSAIRPEGEGTDALRYRILAVSRAGDDKGETRFEQARLAIVRSMPARDAYAFRQLDAVLVQVYLRRTDAGEKRIAWGDLRASWSLQYGDNVAVVRFVRRLAEAGAAASDEMETVPQIAMPERVFVEVEVGVALPADTLPLTVAFGEGFASGNIAIAAHRVDGRPTLYRSDPILVADADDRSRSAAVDGLRLTVRRGATVRAALDRKKTSFLRASVAAAAAWPAGQSWLNALDRAAICGHASFDRNDWERFARQPAETVSWIGGSRNDIPITYGDHAAMLLLRDRFTEAMDGQLREIDRDTGDDTLVDAWYRSMQPAIAAIPDSPLATFQVASPAGPVPFLRAYDDGFADSAFHIRTSAEGERSYRAWRLQATRSAMGFFREKMAASRAELADLHFCDRREMLRLTGSGFRNIAAQLLPLLMKYPRPGQEGYDPAAVLAIPDRVARGYVGNLDQLAEAAGAVKELSTLANTGIVAVALTLVAPGVGIVWNEAVGAVLGTVAGLAVSSYDACWQAYQTYRESEEVQLAFGATTVLGFERYFDAEARRTPWYVTAGVIFGQAVLQGYGIKALRSEDIAEGLSIWRGSRIARQFRTDGTIMDLRALTPNQARDYALFAMEEEQAAARKGMIDQIRTFSRRLFARFAAEAEGQPPPPPPPAEVIAAEDAAFDRARGLSGQPPAADPAADVARAESDGAKAELLSRARRGAGAQALRDAEEEGPAVAAAESERSVWDADTVRALPGEIKVFKPWPEQPGLPLPGVPFRRTINGRVVTFEITEFLGEGEFCAVYKLRRPPPGLGIPDNGEGYVLKLIKPSIKSFEDAPNAAKGVLERMKYGRDLLRRRLPGRQADFLDFADEAGGLMIQKEIKFETGKIEAYPIPGLSAGTQFVNGIDPLKRRAVLQLFKDLADKNLVWLDGNLGNIYFEKVGDGWVAKVLDQDWIVEYPRVRDGVYGEWLRTVEANVAKTQMVPAPRLLPERSARDMMLTLLERYGSESVPWLNFSAAKETYVLPSLVAPDDLWEVFPDFPYPRPGTPR
jgi:hypothetical protein